MEPARLCVMHPGRLLFSLQKMLIDTVPLCGIMETQTIYQLYIRRFAVWI